MNKLTPGTMLRIDYRTGQRDKLSLSVLGQKSFVLQHQLILSGNMKVDERQSLKRNPRIPQNRRSSIAGSWALSPDACHGQFKKWKRGSSFVITSTSTLLPRCGPPARKSLMTACKRETLDRCLSRKCEHWSTPVSRGNAQHLH